MVHFKISGTLPAAWEDFLALDAGVCNISIYSRSALEQSGIDADAPETCPDGWLDIVVDCESVCCDIARLAIADALGIANPEHVVIVESAFCQSF